AGHGGRFSAGDLVSAQHLQELQVSEGAGAGLGQTGIESVEHAGQLEGAQHRDELSVAERAHGCSPNAAGPRSHAGVSTASKAGWTGAFSVPAARMPLTVL